MLAGLSNYHRLHRLILCGLVLLLVGAPWPAIGWAADKETAAVPQVELRLAGLKMVYQTLPKERLTILHEGKPTLALSFLGRLPEAATAAKLDRLRAVLDDGTKLQPSRPGYRGYFAHEISLSSQDPLRFALQARFLAPQSLPASIAVFEGSLSYLVASDPEVLQFSLDQLHATENRHPLLIESRITQDTKDGRFTLKAVFDIPAYQVQSAKLVSAIEEEVDPRTWSGLATPQALPCG